MSKAVLSSMLALAATVALLIAQDAPPPGGPPAGKGGKGGKGKGAPAAPAGPFTRTPDGHPDMQGFWNAANNGGAVFEVQNHPTAKRGVGAGKGAVVDPEDGFIPYQPWAKQKALDLFEKGMDQEPELHCYQSGVPHQNYVQFGFQIAQTPGYVLMTWEFMHSYRIIPTDNRPHISPDIKLFQGDSVGHWEGDTLVVETTNSNDYEATVEDPTAYTRPWKIAYNFARVTTPGYEQMEFGCVEGNQDLGHYTEDVGGKARVVIPGQPAFGVNQGKGKQ
jgi:hypothetical protein